MYIEMITPLTFDRFDPGGTALIIVYMFSPEFVESEREADMKKELNA